MSTLARSRSTDRRYFGVVEALVAENVDPEKEGRVRVRFPWFDGSMTTEWCRVAQPYAGAGYGALFVPEVGDEVLVGFVHGDMRYPIVLGGLYNGEDKPSSHRAQDKDQKLIRTKGGHQLLLDDSKDALGVEVETSSGHLLSMSDADKKVSLATSGGHSVELTDQAQKVTVKSTSGHSVTLDDAASSVTVTTAAGASIAMDASGIKVTGTTVTIEGTAVKLGGAGAHQALVMGTMFMALYNAHTHNCTAPGAPSGPPLAQLTPAMLTTITKAM